MTAKTSYENGSECTGHPAETQDQVQGVAMTDSEARRMLLKTDPELMHGRKLRHLNKLSVYLTKLFKNEAVSPSDCQLTPPEKLILVAFIEKKFKFSSGKLKELFRMPASDFDAEDLIELAGMVNQLPSGRRKEENFKLIFNWVYGFLKEEIENELCVPPTKAEMIFFERYFSQTAQEYQIDPEQFFKPTFSRSMSNQLKTFNSTFIRNVKKSSRFMDAFVTSLQHSFGRSVSTIIEKKILRQCKKWDQELERDGPSLLNVARLCDSITYSKKSKMPWTLLECFSAKAAVEKCVRTIL